MAYSRNDLPAYEPYHLRITDAWGESIDLSKAPPNGKGDVQTVSVGEYTDKGEPRIVTFSGNFHGDDRQQSMEFLARLRGMQQISTQENQLLTLIVSFPQIQMRGRVTKISGPSWKSYPQPGFYEYSFEFTRWDKVRQPKVLGSLMDIVAGEGKPYIRVQIPTADYTNVRDLAHWYYRDEYTDNQRIREILALNGWSIDDSQHQSAGAWVKMPIK